MSQLDRPTSLTDSDCHQQQVAPLCSLPPTISSAISASFIPFTSIFCFSYHSSQYYLLPSIHLSAILLPTLLFLLPFVALSLSAPTSLCKTPLTFSPRFCPSLVFSKIFCQFFNYFLYPHPLLPQFSIFAIFNWTHLLRYAGKWPMKQQDLWEMWS